MKILFVIPEGGHGGIGKQLSLIAPGLLRDQFEVRMAILGRDGPVVAMLRAVGVAVEVLGWTRLIDPQPVWRLRGLVRSFQPDLLAVWGLTALRIASLIRARAGWQPAPRGRARLIVSKPFPPRRGSSAIGLLDRWLLRRADQVIASHQTEYQALQRLGLPAEKIGFVPPGVAPAKTPLLRSELFPLFRLPETARLLVCVGALEPNNGFLDAIWVLDILKYLDDDLHLVLIGDGPDRSRLEDFARALRVQDRTHFAGWRDDATAWLAVADVVWVPNRPAGGIQVALEAMSAARPVIGCQTPGLAEVIADEETGYLVAPGDKVGLARQTRVLLDDPSLRQRLGEAGRKRAEERFAATELVRRWIELVTERSERGGTQA